MDPFVTAEWLEAHLDDVVVCDVRWSLSDGSALLEYAMGHLPGAVFADLDAVLAAPPSDAHGRHPLPDPGVFARAMSALGIGDRDAVVAYDDASGATAARLAWMLRVLGHDAAVLDGGIGAWPHALTAQTPTREPAHFTARPWPPARLAGTLDVAAAAADPATVVIDARASDRYRGDHEPVDARAGHIPGAVNVPFTENFGDDGRLLHRRYLEDRYRRAGVETGQPVVAYCGSGVTACVDLLALEQAGFDNTRLYAGSWSQWSADRTRDVATGSAP